MDYTNLINNTTGKNLQGRHYRRHPRLWLHAACPDPQGKAYGFKGYLFPASRGVPGGVKGNRV